MAGFPNQAIPGSNNTWSGNNFFKGFVGIGASGGSARLPVNINLVQTGAGVGTSGTDVVGVNRTEVFTGDFSAMGGADPGFVWGESIFCSTGSTAGDGKGITSFVALNVEADIQTPAGTTFPLVRGLSAVARFFGATAGATITQAESIRAQAPGSIGGGAGVITNAYSLFVEGPTTGVGSNFGILTDGNAPNRLLGRLDVTGTVIATNGILQLQSDFSANSQLILQNSANGGNIIYQLGKNTGIHIFQSSTAATILEIDNAGIIHTVAANETTGAGTASMSTNCPAVTPGTPHTWEKIITSDGSTCYFPVWK